MVGVGVGEGVEVAAASSSAAWSTEPCGAACGVGLSKPIHATEAFRLSVMPRRCCGGGGGGGGNSIWFSGSCCQGGGVGGVFLCESSRSMATAAAAWRATLRMSEMTSLASGTLNGIR